MQNENSSDCTYFLHDFVDVLDTPESTNDVSKGFLWSSLPSRTTPFLFTLTNCSNKHCPKNSPISCHLVLHHKVSSSHLILKSHLLTLDKIKVTSYVLNYSFGSSSTVSINSWNILSMYVTITLKKKKKNIHTQNTLYQSHLPSSFFFSF